MKAAAAKIQSHQEPSAPDECMGQHNSQHCRLVLAVQLCSGTCCFHTSNQIAVLDLCISDGPKAYDDFQQKRGLKCLCEGTTIFTKNPITPQTFPIIKM